MNDNLLRQRRNLILVSVVLLAFYFLDITVDRLGILGTELTVKNPSGVIVFAWFLWAYFLIRYYQYLQAESDLGIVSSVSDQFKIRANSYVFKRIEKKFIQGEVKISRVGLIWSYSVMEYDPGISSLMETSSGQLPKVMSVIWHIRACAHVIVHTPKFTDHVFPALLALSVPFIFVGDFLLTKYLS